MRALVLAAAALVTVQVATAQFAHLDAHGRSWLQLQGTTGRTWDAVAQVCPPDGLTPANGALGAVNVAGYVWAKQGEVRQMLAEFEPALLNLPSVAGPGYVLTALSFFGPFRPTFEYYTTFGGYQYLTGWTSNEANGVAGTASVSAQYPVFDGTFDTTGVVAISNTSSFRGVWLYRPDVVGSVTCTPAVPNSSGGPAEVYAAGSTTVSHGDLVLHATGLSQHSAGYFLCSQQTASVPMAGGGQGTLCLGGAIGRFSSQVLNSGSAGRFALRVDLTNLPTPSGPAVAQPGETWSFQAWYRDANPASTSNLTSLVTLTFD